MEDFFDNGMNGSSEPSRTTVYSNPAQFFIYYWPTSVFFFSRSSFLFNSVALPITDGSTLYIHLYIHSNTWLNIAYDYYWRIGCDCSKGGKLDSKTMEATGASELSLYLLHDRKTYPTVW